MSGARVIHIAADEGGVAAGQIPLVLQIRIGHHLRGVGQGLPGKIMRNQSEVIVRSVVVEIVDLGFDKSTVEANSPSGRWFPDSLQFKPILVGFWDVDQSR